MSATLDTEHLRTFIAVTETGSFTRAARRRHLSQSTISAHVAALERLLGVGLLDRRPDGTEVSEAGEEFLHRAVALVALTDETLERFRGADDAEPTWGMTDFVVNEFPPHAVAEIAQAVAARRFRLLLGKSHELESGAASGGVDAILTLTFEPPTGAVLIGSVPLVWLESSSRPIYREPASAVPLVLKPETSPLRQRAVALLASTGRTARIAVEATGVDAMLASCRLGL